jgi:proline iminopeptidase
MSSLNDFQQQSYQSGYLEESQGHRVFYRLFGNPKGTPIIFLHGGPGCGFENDYLPLFDLNKINLITFDQRGCGLSLPQGLLEDNTTQLLLQDAERIRELLGIKKWIVCGHSWGATLSILYGLTYPKSINRICIASFFGGLTRDQNWSFDDIRKFYPREVSKLFETRQPEDSNLILDEWLFRNLTTSNTELVTETALRLLELENQVSQSNSKIGIDKSDVNKSVINLYQILFFYGKNNFFITEEYLYKSSTQLPPTILVHGRLDFDCVPEQAFRLQKAYPSVDVRFVKSGYHSVFEEPMSEGFRKAISETLVNVSQPHT